jgi:hypothetical protein
MEQDIAHKIELLRLLAEIEGGMHAGIDGWDITVQGHARAEAFRRMADDLEAVSPAIIQEGVGGL